MLNKFADLQRRGRLAAEPVIFRPRLERRRSKFRPSQMARVKLLYDFNTFPHSNYVQIPLARSLYLLFSHLPCGNCKGIRELVRSPCNFQIKLSSVLKKEFISPRGQANGYFSNIRQYVTSMAGQCLNGEMPENMHFFHIHALMLALLYGRW